MTFPAVVGRGRAESTALHMVGIGLLFAALGMAVSFVIDVLDAGDDAVALAASAVLTAVFGVVLWRSTRVPAQVSAAATFAAVAWTWILVAVFGALPYMLSGLLPNPDEALFEAVSGFTGTGSTVIFPLEEQGMGLLFWRQLTQWYGGMGMIVLAVAVLPFLGVGGLELIRAEAPGETADRLAPRVSATAKRLWLVYAGLTVLVALALLATGDMAPRGGGLGRHVFDAVGHAFTTLATGGFSPYDTSISAFSSVPVEAVLIVGMILGGMNFTLHWRATRGDVSGYWRSAEVRAFLTMLLVAAAALTVINLVDDDTVGTAIRDSAFIAASIGTTTGFGTADFGQWLPSAQLIILYLMLVGGMVGSTSGAMKVFRIRILVSHAWRELRRARHARGVMVVKLGRTSVPEAIVGRVAGFILIYLLLVGVGILAVGALGADIPTAIGSVITTIGCGGPGLGETGPASNFLTLARPARGVLMVLMLFGRLEIFPVLLMFAVIPRGLRDRPRRRDLMPSWSD